MPATFGAHESSNDADDFRALQGDRDLNIALGD